MNQSWIAGIKHSYSSISVPVNHLGTFALSLNLMNYGEIEVTNLDFQDGTGEYYSALDYSASFSYARKFVNWFGFGTSIKYINSQIWHSSASAFAMDLGAQIYTDFLCLLACTLSSAKDSYSIFFFLTVWGNYSW